MNEQTTGEKKKSGKKAAFVLGGVVLALAAVLLIGFTRLGWRLPGGEAPAEEPAAAEAPAETCTVSFRLHGETLQSFALLAGEMLPAFEPTLAGIELTGWLDEAGNPADPWAGPVQGDAVYTAELRLVLTAHVPFLFPDENGFLRPDEPLSPEELDAAREALYPAGPGEDLTLLLREFEAIAEDAVSRREFARQIAQLIGWTPEERLLPDEGSAAPVDLDPEDPDFALLLEASVPHRAEEKGLIWPESGLRSAYDKGMLLLGTELYYVGEDGFLLRGGSVGPLSFGEDGRFSSGDEELDGYVTECLAAIEAQYPEEAADRFAMLRRCYEYVRDGFSYLGRGHKTESDPNWSEEDAKLMFRTGKGNCYNYAAVFRALARRLGFPANTILRSLDSPNNIHAWTDIVIRGIPYVFDPQLEDHYHNDRYMLRYTDAGKYGYTRPDPAEFLGYAPYANLKIGRSERPGEVISVSVGEDETYVIYLPYGYDPEGSYRVLLYLNGVDGDPSMLLEDGAMYPHTSRYYGVSVNIKSFLDYMIESGECDPLIVVSTEGTNDKEIGARCLRLLQYTAEHYATCAAGSAEEDLVAARDSFAIAGPAEAAKAVCTAIRSMPDVFGCCGLFSGLEPDEETPEAFRQKGEIRFLMMAGGDRDYREMEKIYDDWSQFDNVADSCLMFVTRTDRNLTAYNAALRYLLFQFSPHSGEEGAD